MGKVEYCGSICTLGLFQTKGKMCAKFGSDRFRNANLCKVQTFSFILKLYEHKLYIYIYIYTYIFFFAVFRTRLTNVLADVRANIEQQT